MIQTLETAIANDIDGFYNGRRRPSALDWKSSLDFGMIAAQVSNWSGTKARRVQNGHCMLYDPIISQDTANEPGGKPDPQFPLSSTLNWMGALWILIEDQGIDFGTVDAFYSKQRKKSMSAGGEHGS